MERRKVLMDYNFHGRRLHKDDLITFDSAEIKELEADGVIGKTREAQEVQVRPDNFTINTGV